MDFHHGGKVYRDARVTKCVRELIQDGTVEETEIKVEEYLQYQGYCKGMQEAIAKDRVMTYSGGQNHYPKVLVGVRPGAGGGGAYRELWECPFCPEGEDCIIDRRKKEE